MQAPRIGHGIDIHPFVTGRPLILGGVTIPSDRGLDGHSDADALTHAIIDALLGAAGLPDIGCYFVNTDPRWKGISSLELLRQAWSEISQKFTIGNIDVAVLLEAPKLRPHVPEMQKKISAVLGCDVSQINIKATTAERLGFVGREEGIYCSAVVLLIAS